MYEGELPSHLEFLRSCFTGSSPVLDGRGSTSGYPWDDWLQPDHELTLTLGVDFHCSPGSLRQQLYREARNRGYSARVRLDGTEVRVRVVGERREGRGRPPN